MELTMASQLDAKPWAVPSTAELQDPTPSLPGREFFSELGIVRRKPARRDAPISMSKSCSDKLALKQCTSLLSSTTSLIVAPSPEAYLHALVIPRDQIHSAAWARAFCANEGRFSGIEKVAWAGGYAFRHLTALGTNEEFIFSKAAVARRASDAGTVAFGGATAWNCFGLEESLEGGVVRGMKGYRARSASSLSRRNMWALAVQVAGLLGGQEKDEDLQTMLNQLAAETYASLKEGELLQPRRRVKENVWGAALLGWVRNTGDDGFGIAE